MRWLEDMAILVKMLIAPLFGCAMMLVVAGVFLVTYRNIEDSGNRRSQIDRLSTSIEQTSHDIAQAHASLFRSLTWKQSGVEANLVDQAVAEVHRFTDNAIARINSITDDKLPAAVLDENRKALASYHDATDQVLNMLAVDAFVATMMMTDTHLKFVAADQAFDRLVAAVAAMDAEIIDTVNATMTNGLTNVLVAAALAIVLSFGAAALLARTLSQAVRTLTAAMQALADGNHDAAVPGTDRRDELGAMAQTVLVFKTNLLETDRLNLEREQIRAHQDEEAQRLDRLTRAFDQSASGMLGGVADAAGGMTKTAATMRSVSDETNRSVEAVASASEQASSNVQAVACATEELSGSIAEISRQVALSTGIINNAVEEAQVANQRVNGLTEAAGRIGQVVQLINAIASQTNLLALNATIEAARAGNAGKGFAVVASEVKNLANQTAKATDEIASQVLDIQRVTGETATAISQIGSVIGRIQEIATTIASAVEQQGAATQEIARNVQDAARGTQVVSSSIGGVRAAAGSTLAAAADVHGAAEGLAVRTDDLRRLVTEFLQGVRRRVA